MRTAIKTVGVPREVKTAEHRVAMTPDGVRELERHGIQVHVEAGAGEGASIADADFVAAGAEIVPTAEDAWAQEIATLAPLTLEYCKLALNTVAELNPADDRVDKAMIACWNSDDAAEGQRARSERRPPEFRGR